MAINPFRAVCVFENRERPSRKLKKIAYVSFSGEMKSECIRIYNCPESQHGDQPLQSCFFFFFFESRERPSQKLKKIAYVFEYILL